ncbi:MAG: M15 family metallopeptidase [Clostridium sp.]
MKKLLKKVLIIGIAIIIAMNFIYNINITNNTVQSSILLVNKDNGINKSFVPKDLVQPNIKFTNEASEEERLISKEIQKPLEKLFSQAEKEGIILLGNSGYRSYNLQNEIYKNRVKSVGKKLADDYVAKAGFSEHQTGLCIDVTNESRNFSKGTREADWVQANAHKFGFIIRYPEGKKSITGVEYEPWHIRYVGEEIAKAIYNNKITLEEYI